MPNYTPRPSTLPLEWHLFCGKHVLMEKASNILATLVPDIKISRQATRRSELIELVREKREEESPDLIYNSRPFVITGLPLRRPAKGTLIHERRNGDFMLQVTGHPTYGLPFGQDRLIPIWVATLALRQKSQVVQFRSAAEILREFDLPNNGKTYRRLVEGFRRIFTSTIFFGTDEQFEKEQVWEWSRFHYFDKMRLWFSKNTEQETLDGDLCNAIKLSDPFWNELQDHPIPGDRNAVRALASNPGAMDLYLWLTWRSWTVKGTAQIPLFGPKGLTMQLGCADQSQRRFRQTLQRWLELVQTFWPASSAHVSSNGQYLIVSRSIGLPSKVATIL